MSFFDEPDQPAAARSRTSPPPRRKPPSGPTTDRQTMMVRRSVAAGGGVLLLILFVLGVRGCLDSRKERAIKDYVRDVAALVQESDEQSKALFQLLSDSGDAGDVDIENALNGLRVSAEQLVERARDTDRPDEMADAQRFLIESFEFRRDGVAGIADALPAAIANEDARREGTDTIAVQMQLFLTSDVIYGQRVVPSMERTLKEEELTGQEEVPQSQFLPEVQWLEPGTVSDRVSKLGGSGGSDEDAAPGLHGNGLGAVTLGGTTLPPGGSASIRLADDLTFTVQVANQGENTETDVAVNVTLGRGGDSIRLSKQLDEIAAGETKPVELPLADRPPTGQNVPVSVEIEAVPGESKTDNNKGSFSVIFTR